MTIVAYHLQPDAVEIVTDTCAYRRAHNRADADSLRDTSKCIYLPHLDVAVAGTGPHYLMDLFTVWATMTGGLHDVDDLAGAAVSELPHMWQQVLKTGSKGPAIIYLFGWSQQHGRYMGYHHIGGEPEPSPIDWKALDVRLGAADYTGPTTRGVFHVTPEYDDPPALATAAAPTDDRGWINLAEAKRAAGQRRRDEGREHVLIDGRLIRTRLAGRAALQSTIHRFDVAQVRHQPCSPAVPSLTMPTELTKVDELQLASLMRNLPAKLGDRLAAKGRHASEAVTIIVSALRAAADELSRPGALPDQLASSSTLADYTGSHIMFSASIKSHVTTSGDGIRPALATWLRTAADDWAN